MKKVEDIIRLDPLYAFALACRNIAIESKKPKVKGRKIEVRNMDFEERFMTEHQGDNYAYSGGSTCEHRHTWDGFRM